MCNNPQDDSVKTKEVCGRKVAKAEGLNSWEYKKIKTYCMFPLRKAKMHLFSDRPIFCFHSFGLKVFHRLLKEDQDYFFEIIKWLFEGPPSPPAWLKILPYVRHLSLLLIWYSIKKKITHCTTSIDYFIVYSWHIKLYLSQSIIWSTYGYGVSLANKRNTYRKPHEL